MYPDLTWFIGKTLSGVSLNPEKDEITFTFTDGSSKRLGTEGDCCSSSWIEHLEAPPDVFGAVITAIDEPEMPPHDNHECLARVGEDAYGNECVHDVLAVYHTRFRTDKGDIVLEYRNDSNGYYGGSLTDLGEG